MKLIAILMLVTVLAVPAIATDTEFRQWGLNVLNRSSDNPSTVGIKTVADHAKSDQILLPPDRFALSCLTDIYVKGSDNKVVDDFISIMSVWGPVGATWVKLKGKPRPGYTIAEVNLSSVSGTTTYKTASSGSSRDSYRSTNGKKRTRWSTSSSGSHSEHNSDKNLDVDQEVTVRLYTLDSDGNERTIVAPRAQAESGCVQIDQIMAQSYSSSDRYSSSRTREQNLDCNRKRVYTNSWGDSHSSTETSRSETRRSIPLEKSRLSSQLLSKNAVKASAMLLKDWRNVLYQKEYEQQLYAGQRQQVSLTLGQ